MYPFERRYVPIPAIWQIGTGRNRIAGASQRVWDLRRHRSAIVFLTIVADNTLSRRRELDRGRDAFILKLAALARLDPVVRLERRSDPAALGVLHLPLLGLDSARVLPIVE